MERVSVIWERIYNSYWLIPSALTVASALLAVVTISIDRSTEGGTITTWVGMGVGAEGARGVLSAISGSMITVTGVVFSITVVALQLASQQFTPRVLRTFAEDRQGHLVLGTLIGTFTYALLVELSVRSPGEGRERMVPSLSVSVAVLLALLSVAALIFFIQHTANAIRASTIINHVTRDIHNAMGRLYPGHLGRPEEGVSRPPEPPSGMAWSVPCTESGYLEAVDEKALFAIADGADLSLRIHPHVGDFVLAGDTLVTAWPAADGDQAELERRVNTAFLIGPERTIHQDIRRGILELVEIGVKALSPSVNDPTTAMLCLDRLAEVIARLGRHDFPPPARIAEDGRVRVWAPRQDFGTLVHLAFDQIRHYGAESPAVMLHTIEVLRRVALRIPPQRREALRAQLVRIREGAPTRIALGSDAQRVGRAADEALADLSGPTDPDTAIPPERGGGAMA